MQEWKLHEHLDGVKNVLLCSLFNSICYFVLRHAALYIHCSSVSIVAG